MEKVVVKIGGKSQIRLPHNEVTEILGKAGALVEFELVEGVVTAPYSRWQSGWRHPVVQIDGAPVTISTADAGMYGARDGSFYFFFDPTETPEAAEASTEAAEAPTDTQPENDVVKWLVGVPVTDPNFRSNLKVATTDELKMALGALVGKPNAKGKLTVLQRELKRRGLEIVAKRKAA
jgi:hypothetical protein